MKAANDEKCLEIVKKKGNFHCVTVRLHVSLIKKAESVGFDTYADSLQLDYHLFLILKRFSDPWNSAKVFLLRKIKSSKIMELWSYFKDDRK